MGRRGLDGREPATAIKNVAVAFGGRTGQNCLPARRGRQRSSKKAWRGCNIGRLASDGGRSYLAKQAEVLASAAHLVEIDLLRGGQHVLAMPEWLARSRASYDYLVSINRSEGRRDRFQFYPCRLRDRLPRIGVPLAGDDPDVPLDLQAGLARVYEAGAYDDQADYAKPCHPPLASEDQAWAAELIRGTKTKQAQPAAEN